MLPWTLCHSLTSPPSLLPSLPPSLPPLAGTGVASMIAGAKAGADAVDAAMDAMSGTTSQPSLGAIVGALKNTPQETGLKMSEINAVNEYWEEARGLYAPFESGQKSGSSDVYDHEMPGGQVRGREGGREEVVGGRRNVFESMLTYPYCPPSLPPSLPPSFTADQLDVPEHAGKGGREGGREGGRCLFVMRFTFTHPSLPPSLPPYVTVGLDGAVGADQESLRGGQSLAGGYHQGTCPPSLPPSLPLPLGKGTDNLRLNPPSLSPSLPPSPPLTPQVTPSSKVVGDLAQFMVQNKLTEADVRARAEELSFPSSVIEYFQGFLGKNGVQTRIAPSLPPSLPP